MSIDSILFNIGARKGDRKRDKRIPFPKGVVQIKDISYGPHRKHNRMDIYYPEGADRCPIIVSVHGGGFVYGDKELYSRYCMDLARRGFAVVNFNYRLAPRWKFPAPLEDINNVMLWLSRHAKQYHADNNSIFMVGDSAGAQLASQYAAIATNPDYAALFHMTVPDITIRALGLNCGMYAPAAMAKGDTGLARDYLGPKADLTDPRLNVLDAITPDYPPAYIATSHGDFLKANAQPMYDHLTGQGIEAQWKCYGSEGEDAVGHVFHVTITLPEAVECNDDEAEFFRAHL